MVRRVGWFRGRLANTMRCEMRLCNGDGGVKQAGGGQVQVYR